MLNNECTMSCDPANTRRPQVSGPVGEKLATEDCTGVGDQASVLVNTTGSNSSSNNKKYIQQAFHPSLFIGRSRSASVGSSPIKLTTEDTSDGLTPIIGNNSGPPSWQKVPVTRKSKKEKSPLVLPQRLLKHLTDSMA